MAARKSNSRGVKPTDTGPIDEDKIIGGKAPGTGAVSGGGGSGRRIPQPKRVPTRPTPKRDTYTDMENRRANRGAVKNRVVDTSKMSKSERKTVRKHNEAVRTYVIRDEAARRAALKAAETRRENASRKAVDIWSAGKKRGAKVGFSAGAATGVVGSNVINAIVPDKKREKKTTASNAGKQTGRARSEYPRPKRNK